VTTAAVAEPKPFEKVHRALVDLEPAQAGVRRALGLPARDPDVLERIARRYRPPAWAQGCISGHDALFLYDLVRAVLAGSVVHHDGGAHARELERRRAPDAAAGAGDDDDFVLQ